MRAARYQRWGGEVTLHEVPEPVAGPGEVLVRVRAAGLNPKDAHVAAGRHRHLSGEHFPRGVGYDLAGEVVNGAAGFAPGDRVYGMRSGWMGATCAELAVVPEQELARMPSSLGFEEAAAVPLAAQTALQALVDEGGAGEGKAVLIHGASGGVGTFAIQLAHAMGCTITTTSGEASVKLCRSLGADLALDRREWNPFDAGPFDVILDVHGDLHWHDAHRALSRHGRYVTTVVTPHRLLAHASHPLRCRLVRVHSSAKQLGELAGKIDAGEVRVVLDRVYSLEEVEGALAHVATEHTHGKVVVRTS